MGEVILKKDGKPVEIDQFPRIKYPYLRNYTVFLNNLIVELKDSKNIDIEVNLVEWGQLGSELLLDNRLYSDKIKSDYDSINNLNAIAIYYLGLNGNLLSEEFRDRKICYIQLQQTYEINMIRIAYHEIHHFIDPFIPREWQIFQENGRTFLIYGKTIKAYVRFGLNEYYANLFAFSSCLTLINDILKDKLSPSLIEEYNKALIERIPSYLNNLSNKLNDFINVVIPGEIDNRRIIDPKAEIIKFLWSRFFHQIYYFFGGWKAHEDKELDTSLIQETWNNLITEIQDIGLNDMIELLKSFKNLMLESSESEDELVNRIDDLFLRYYRENLDLDFISLI